MTKPERKPVTYRKQDGIIIGPFGGALHITRAAEEREPDPKPPTLDPAEKYTGTWLLGSFRADALPGNDPELRSFGAAPIEPMTGEGDGPGCFTRSIVVTVFIALSIMLGISIAIAADRLEDYDRYLQAEARI